MIKKLIQNTTRVYLSACRFQSTLTPEFTSVRYSVPRNQKFATLSETDINFFHSIIDNPDNNILQDPDDLEKYNVDWLKIVRGNSQIVLKPKTTEQISKILKYCYQNDLAVAPIGGNTGLVGGSVPVHDEIVISLERMNKILNIDSISGIVTCESGIVLESLNQQLNEHEPALMVPLDLGAKGSCQIGGNISTNAGGLRFLRYGSLHGNILGLEVVLPNGEILNLREL